MSVTRPTLIALPAASPVCALVSAACSSEPPHAASEAAPTAIASSFQSLDRLRIPLSPPRFSTGSLKLVTESTTAPRARVIPGSVGGPAPAHVTLAVVLQVRGGRLQ